VALEQIDERSLSCWPGLLSRAPAEPLASTELVTELDERLGTRSSISHLARGCRCVCLADKAGVFGVLVLLAALMLAIPVAMPFVARPG
jgi:hypothetical protein